MSATKTKFLVTGATGFIGGSVLNRFLEHPRADSIHFTVLVRDPKKAEKFEKLGISAVVGSHSDAALMEKVASEADVVIATADCDDLVAATATLAGLKKKYEATGVPPIFINTSGTGVLTDDARGMFAGTMVYDDSDADQIESLAPTQLHRNVDLAIVNADAAGYVKTYIILPSTIYGIASGRLVDAGVQNPHSIQIPSLVKASIDRGRAGMVGEGKNLWPNVEIHELSNLFTLLYDAIVTNPSLGHGREGYFFGASGEHSMYDIGTAIGKAMVGLGLTQSAEPTTFTQAELDKYFGGSPYLGTNSRCRATHSASIGWKPTKSTSNMLASIQPEVETLHAKAK